MANFNFNRVMLGGRLTADPELKVTVTQFTGIPGVATIKCEVVKPSGNQQTITVDVELKAQTRHTVVFDLPNAGSAEFAVQFDGEIVETKEEEFEMNDNA